MSAGVAQIGRAAQTAFLFGVPLDWRLSSSSDPVALAIVDGLGIHSGQGPHYSRRTPGATTFTGMGEEVVLVTNDGCAVWAVVRQCLPCPRGSGASRGRTGVPNRDQRRMFRNNMFRNLGPGLSSDLICTALVATKREWIRRYGDWPKEPLRTEIEIKKVRSRNPGYCYQCAGWKRDRIVRGKLYMVAP